MNESINELLNLERQIIKDREALLNLCQKYGNSDDSMIEEKLKFLKSEIDYLDKQYSSLSSRIDLQSKNQTVADEKPMTANAVAKNQADTPINEVYEDEATEKLIKLLSSRTNNDSDALNKDDNTKKNPVVNEKIEETKKTEKSPSVENVTKEKPKKKKASLESKVGGLVMGVLAAGLIFVGVILFSNALTPSLGNVFKQIAFYTLGFVFVAGGILSATKLKSSDTIASLFLSLGMGELYVSLFVSNMVFKSINDTVLMVLILVWSISLILLKKFGSSLFNIIGNIGVCVAVYLGFFLSNSTGDPVKMFIVTVFFIVSKISFYVFFKKRDSVKDNVIFHVFNTIELLLLIPGNICFEAESFEIARLAAIFICVAVSVFDLFLILHDKDKNKIFFAFFGFIYVGLYVVSSIFLFDSLFSDTAITLFASFASLSIILVVTEFVYSKTFGCYFIELLILLTQTILLLLNKTTYEYGYIFGLIIPLIILGFVRKNHLFKMFSLLAVLVYAFMPASVILRIVVGVLSLAAFYLCLYLAKDQYKTLYKLETFGISLLYVITVSITAAGMNENLSEQTMQHIMFTIMLCGSSLLNILFMFTPLSSNKEKKRDTFYIDDILNCLLAIYGLAIFLVFEGDIRVLYLAVSVVLTLVAFYNGYFANRKINKYVPLVLIFFLRGNEIDSDPGVVFPAIRLSLVVIYFVLSMVLCYSKKERYSTAVKIVSLAEFCLSFSTIMFSVVGLRPFLIEEVVSNVTLFVLGVTVLLFMFTPLAKNKKDKTDTKIILFIITLVLILYIVTQVLSVETPFEIIWLFILVIAYLVKAYIYEEKFDRIANLVFTFFILFTVSGLKSKAVLAALAISVVGQLVEMYLKSDFYKKYMKIILYIAGSLVCIEFGISFLHDEIAKQIITPMNIVVASLAVHNLLYAFTSLSKNPEEDEKDFETLPLILNHGIALLALLFAYIQKSPDDIIAGALVILLLPIGAKRIWRNREDNKALYILSIIECSLIPFLVCDAWGTSGVVADIVAIVIATSYIILGFVLTSKFPRIYGLVVIILMIFKMVMLDFDYSSALGYALAFLVAGFICLGISLIYNVINKKIEV